MNPSWAVGTSTLALIEGGLVALPRTGALGPLRRLRSPLWAAVLPASIVVGTFAPLAVPSLAVGMVVLGALATLPLAAAALLWVVRGPRRALISVGLAAGVGFLAGGWGAQLSTTALTAGGCLALGVALAQLIPARWMLTGILSMCLLDVAFLALGVGQASGALLAGAAEHIHGPALGQAQVGPASIDYPDLVLAAVLGGFLAGRPSQRGAAMLVVALAAGFFMLAPPTAGVWPATVPVAVTALGLRVTSLAQRPASGRIRC